MKSPKKFLSLAYKKLFKAFGPQHWWPGETPFEVIVGAILTQNTNWQNVEKAIRNLKREKKLSPEALRKIPIKTLAKLIRPAGYFNVKAKRLKNFIEFFFNKYGGKIQKMRKEPLARLREQLLSVNGIGPETADSVLLYALDKPIFVVDAYTKRIFSRHKIIPESAEYASVQELFMESLPQNLKLFNEYHALIVSLGKDFCRKIPDCATCPLRPCLR